MDIQQRHQSGRIDGGDVRVIACSGSRQIGMADSTVTVHTIIQPIILHYH